MALTRAQLVPSTWLSLFAENPPSLPFPLTVTQSHTPRATFPLLASCSVLASPVKRSSVIVSGWLDHQNGH